MIISLVLGLVLLLMPKGDEQRTFSEARNVQLRSKRSTQMLHEIIEDALFRFKRDPHGPGPDHGHHILDHIRDEIHKGHVTPEKMAHWWKEIQAALNDGSVTMDDVQHLMESLERTDSFSAEHCCWFG